MNDLTTCIFHFMYLSIIILDYFSDRAMLDTAARLFYRYVCKRSSTFTLGIVISAVFFERAYDEACEYIFETVNSGVCCDIHIL